MGEDDNANGISNELDENNKGEKEDNKKESSGDDCSSSDISSDEDELLTKRLKEIAAYRQAGDNKYYQNMQNLNAQHKEMGFDIAEKQDLILELTKARNHAKLLEKEYGR